MIIVVVNECLEVPNLDLLVAVLALHKTVQLNHREVTSQIVGVVLKQLLDDFIGLEFVRGNPEDIEGLLLGDEATLDSQTLLSDLFSALVAELFHLTLHSLLQQVLSYLIKSLTDRERPNKRLEHWDRLEPWAYGFSGLFHSERGLSN